MGEHKQTELKNQSKKRSGLLLTQTSEGLHVVEVHGGQTGEVGYQSSSASSLTVGALIQCDKPVH